MTPVPLLMGIVNVTPDSFYAASRVPSVEAAVTLGLELVEEGAEALDVGGESTRPGSDPVGAGEELRRVVPVVEALARRAGVPVSVDTSKAGVARAARRAGASWLNDVTALRGDPDMLREALRFEKVILMHMLGTSPKTMQERPEYENVTEEVKGFLEGRCREYVDAGGDASRVVYDPGIGFGKTLEHNLELLRGLPELGRLGPVLVGVSRKSFLGVLPGPAGKPATAGPHPSARSGLPRIESWEGGPAFGADPLVRGPGTGRSWVRHGRYEPGPVAARNPR